MKLLVRHLSVPAYLQNLLLFWRACEISLGASVNPSQEHLLERITQFYCQIPPTGLAPPQYRPTAYLLTLDIAVIADLTALVRRALDLRRLILLLDQDDLYEIYPVSLSDNVFFSSEFRFNEQWFIG